MAPHGGWIEPGSSQVAEAIAEDDYSLYLFEGLIPGRPHHELHITSTRFDEPQGLQLVGAADTVIAVHGRADGDDPHTTWLGGRSATLRDAIAFSLSDGGFQAATANHRFPARNPMNICNRAATGAGVQLEVPRTLRDQLRHDPVRLRRFAAAVREALSRG